MAPPTGTGVLSGRGLCLALSLSYLAAASWMWSATASAASSVAKAAAGPSALPRVVVLGTGGTIAGQQQPASGLGYTAAEVAIDALIEQLPQLRRIARVRGRQVLQLPSQKLRPADWLTLARAADKALSDPEVDGVVVTHGTDTLEETAYFLNLVLKTAKPLVLVGAMRPVTAMSADGPFNLYEAVLVAGHPDARGQGVMVLLNDQVHAAREVTKANTSMTDAFRSPEVGALATLEADRVTFYRRSSRRHTQAAAFDLSALKTLLRVEILYGYAGASPLPIDALVADKVAGLVYAGVGNGNFGDDIDAALRRARQAGVMVVRSSRVGSGNVARNLELNDDQRDFVVADNLNPQKARVLLMLALAQGCSSEQLQRRFEQH